MTRPPAQRFEQLPEGGYPPSSPRGIETNRGMGAIDMSWIVGFLRRRHRTIIASVVATLVAVAGISFVLPPTYQSETTVLVESRSTGEDAQALDALAILGRGRQIETEIELIQSRRVLEPVLDDIMLEVSVRADSTPPESGETETASTGGGAGAADVEGGGRAIGTAISDGESANVLVSIVAGPSLPEGRHELVTGGERWVLIADPNRLELVQYAEGFKSTVAADSGRELHVSLPDAVAEAMVGRPVWRSDQAAALGKSVGAARAQRDADLIRITCEDETAVGAQRLCRSVQGAYLDLRVSMQRGEATSMREFLGDQLDVAAERLRTAEDSLEAYSTRHGVVALDDRASAEVRSLTDLRAQRDVLEAERAALSRVLEDIRGGGRSRYRELATFPSFVDNEALTRMVTSLVDLENRRAELAVRRTDTNPDLAALDERIRTIEEQLLSMGANYSSSLGHQVASLDQTIRSMSGRLSTIPQRQVDWARLSRGAEQAENVYEMLEARMSEARIAEAVSLPNVRVVDEPSLPTHQSSPRLAMNLLLGLMGGLSLGIGLALLREQLDPGIRGRAEVERETGLSVLTIVPRVSQPGPVLLLETAASDGRNKRNIPPLGGLGRSRPIGEETAQFFALEAFRGLATELRLARRDFNGGDGLRSLAVTSANRAEGKTLTACNLALVYASKGHRTVLVDADMRASGVARFFGLDDSEPGLSDLLAGRAQWLDPTIRRVSLQNGSELSILPAGRPTSDGAALLESDRFRKLLDTALERYEFAVFDTPPLNLITDAAAVAAAVEGVLVVVRSGVTEKEHLEYTLQKLRRVNGNVLGVVLNDARVSDEYHAHYEEYAARQPAPGESK